MGAQQSRGSGYDKGGAVPPPITWQIKGAARHEDARIGDSPERVGTLASI